MSLLYVKAYHGTCTSFHSSIHKPQFLYGLRDHLRKTGIRMDLVPVDFADYCMLEMCGHEIFRCKLQHLKFNTHYERDEVCNKAIQAVLEAAVKFRRARACLWFWTALDHQLFRRSKYAPKDYWPSKNIHFITDNQCIECTTCCDISKEVKERPDDREVLTKKTPT